MAPVVTREDLLAAFRDAYVRRDYMRAMQACRDLVALEPYNAQGWRNMGSVYTALGQLDDALEATKRAAEIEPRDPLTHLNLGVIAARADDHDEAVQHYLKATELAPAMAEGYMGIASSYFHLGDIANAVYYYSRAYQQAPGNAEVARNFGVALMRMGQLPKAEFYLRQATEFKPDWAEAHVELGEVLRRLGEDRDAMVELLKGLRIRQRPDGLVSLSRLHLKYHEPRKSLIHLQRALELAPDYAPAHHALGLCHAELKNWDLAVRHLEVAYSRDPDQIECALDLAEAFAASGRNLDRAYRLASAVRIKDPSQVRAFDVMGWCLFRQGRPELAKEELEKARMLLELAPAPRPEHAIVYEHLAEVYTVLKDTMMAREMYHRASEADPNRKEEWDKRSGAL